MKLIQVLPIGIVDQRLVADLCEELATEFRARSEALATPFDPAPARHLERQQYYSTELLARMEKLLICSGDVPIVASVGNGSEDAAATRSRKPLPSTNAARLLGVTALDLYIPTLTYLFGEAQLAGLCAVVSTYRLRQEFYGLPPDPRLLAERLLKESVHELGHTLNLRHCDDYRCVMAPSHSVEYVDLKSSRFCPACRAQAGL
jgi:Peptidase family M54